MIQKSIRILTKSLEKTRALGQKIGAHITGDMFIALTGDLGSGKTVFTQGLAAGLDVPKNCRVTSPTYTLVHEYSGRLTLYHVDLYRIEHSDELEDFGFHDMLGSKGVVIVEWADKLPKNMLSEQLHVHLDMRDETTRDIRIHGVGIEASRLVDLIDTSKSSKTW